VIRVKIKRAAHDYGKWHGLPIGWLGREIRSAGYEIVEKSSLEYLDDPEFLGMVVVKPEQP